VPGRRNPYTYSTPAREETFAGRKSETERLRRFASGITESNAAHLADSWTPRDRQD